MASKTLKEWLENTFSNNEISNLPNELRDIIIELDLVDDVDSFIKQCELKSVNFKMAGAHRKKDWEDGWAGNGVYYSDDKNLNNLPYYFKKNEFVRLQSSVYRDLSGFSEVYFLRALQVILFN